MKIIKCESGKLINADHIVSIEQIHQQGLNKYAVAARTVLDDLITIASYESKEEAKKELNTLYLYLIDELLIREMTKMYGAE